MLIFETLTARNALSIGNVEQVINLRGLDLTLLLGINNDQSDTDARNGVGKTTILQILSFVIYGNPITSIKKDRLINNINGKDLYGCLDFSKNGKRYRIERGRKPNFLRFTVNDQLIKAPDGEEGQDESQGESKWTQAEIDKVVGMSHGLFRHIVVLHTKVRPFLDLGAKDQRDLIEEMFGITALSAKAENLKKIIKETKDGIRDEEVRIDTIKNNNSRIQKSIDELLAKKARWDKTHEQKVDDILASISEMIEIDIDMEVLAHKRKAVSDDVTYKIKNVDKRINDAVRSLTVNTNNKDKLEKKLLDAADHKCPTCGQETHDNVHETLLLDLSEELIAVESRIAELTTELLSLDETKQQLDAELAEVGDIGPRKYRTLEEALDHKNNLVNLEKDFERESLANNPYLEQINNLSTTALQEISYAKLNELMKTKEHQDFLFKLLTSKDSFIRKRIIDKNMVYLNSRLSYYLTKLSLPHQVLFRSDLSVDIIKLGKENDFAQLSNGEQNRVILALTWAFRDVWENEQGKLNFLAIDEMVDSGMDNAGTEHALEILKTFVREHNKDVLLISHKDSLISRVDNIMYAQKENDFTTFYEGTG